MRQPAISRHVLLACVSVSQVAHGGPVVVAAGSGSAVLAAKVCRADESLFKAVRTTPIEGGLRVDYQLVETGGARWANMNAALLRKFGIRVGAEFCMPLDTGDAAESAANYE